MRGGLVYIDRLVRERPTVRGIVSATRGNHGQSLAFAGRAAGVAVTIVVPRGNSPDKNAAVRLVMRCTHHLVEPAGAAALAGLLADRAAEPGRVDGRRIGVIVSGGNLDAPMLAEILAGRTPSP